MNFDIEACDPNSCRCGATQSNSPPLTDTGGVRYGSTAVVNVTAGFSGTATIDFQNPGADTFFQDGNGIQIPIGQLVGATINVPTGSCCEEPCVENVPRCNCPAGLWREGQLCPANGGPPCPCLPPPLGMVGWWTLDEAVGPTAFDYVGINDGTHTNGPTPLVGQHVENSLCFDGSNDYVDVPPNNTALDFGTGPFTIDAWVRRDPASPNSPPSVLVDKRDAAGVGYSLSVSFGRVFLTMSAGASTNYGTVASHVPADGLWHHVAVTVSRVANGGRFYVDGVPLDTFTPLAGNIDNGSTLWIGRSDVAGNRPWLGCIDEVELFNRALSAAEILDIFQAGIAGKCKPCPHDLVQIVYDGGRDEACAMTAPNDPAKRSNCLNTAYPAVTWKDFDDMTSNRFFGHTFDNLPKGVTGATLEVCMKPHNDIPNNDSINFCLNRCSPPAWGWGRLIKDLPGNGGTWNSGDPCQCFMLDLAALPNAGGGTTNLLPCLNSRCRFDMLVQDDTAVEFAQLNMTICPCTSRTRTYRAGIRDCLAAPNELSTRCQGVTDLRLINPGPPFLWKDFDDFTIDRGVGQTFNNLSKGIVSAQFETGMEFPGGGNDTMALDLKECTCYPMSGGPPQFAWGSALSALTSAPYCGGGSPQRYTLDLGTLVPTGIGYTPGVGILGALADRSLDVYVQDDHAVDYMSLRVLPCPCKRRLHAFGLPQEAVGDADIVLNPDGSVSVVNIGSSGEDGVTIELGESQGFEVKWNPGGSLPGDATIKFATTGTVGGVASRSLGALTMTASTASDDLEIVADYSAVGSATQRIEIYNNHSLVQVISGHTGTLRIYKFCPNDLNRRFCPPPDTCTKRLVNLGGVDTACYQLGSTDDQLFVPNGWGGAPLLGDEVRILAENPSGPISAISSLDIVGTIVPSFTITSESVAMFGLLHTILGSAIFEPDGQTLTISNIGSSGEDGVSIDVGQAESFSLNWAPLDPFGDVPDGAYEELRAIGSLGGNPNQSLGTLRVTDIGSEYEITADYSPIGSTSQRLEVYDQGKLMTVIAGHTGPVARVPQWPDKCGKGVATIAGARIPCYRKGWPFSVSIAIVGGPTVMGDELRVLAENTDEIFDYLQTFSVVASDIPEITFTEETVVDVVQPPGHGDNTCQTNAADTGIPCSTDADCTEPAECGLKNRYISITPADLTQATSIRVRVVTAPQFPGIVGHVFYAGPEVSVANSPNPALRGAPLQCIGAGRPHSQVWTTGVLHLWGASAVPTTSTSGITMYAVAHCDANGDNCSTELNVEMAKWGDVVRPFTGGSQPNFGDVSAIVAKFSNMAMAPNTARADIVGPQGPGTPNTPNQSANFSDVSNDVSAFSGFPYPYAVNVCPP